MVSPTTVQELPFRPLHVPLRRVEILVAEDLRQRHEIVSVVGKKSMRHRVPQDVRVQVEATDRRVFVTKRPNPSISQRSPLTSTKNAV
jgi:hypothetical protein